jgi:GT2 family glycosyltransferase
MSTKKKDVSIVIVCMNNLKNLYPCLDSIKIFTSVNYEIFVVAYLFSKENLNKLKTDFPKVKIIESNEIRGFSENNNLALRQTNGKFCLILNDDTTFNSPVIDQLIEDIEQYKDAAIFSPKIINSDGSVVCGRTPLTIKSHLIYNFFRLNYTSNKHKKYINQEGIFQTYNIQGCCFLIRTNIFKKLNFFDEKYFFCPEDIALSTTLNELGYKCYVDSNISIYHNHATTYSKTIHATYPAMQKGELIFHSKNSNFRNYIIGNIMRLNYLMLIFIWFISYNKKKNIRKTNIVRYKNALFTILSKKTPKEIFTLFFNKTNF